MSATWQNSVATVPALAYLLNFIPNVAYIFCQDTDLLNELNLGDG